MAIEDILAQMDALLEEGARSPFSSKVRVDAQQLQKCAEDIRLQLPAELVKAQEILSQKERILFLARQEATQATASARQEAAELTDTTDKKIREGLAAAEAAAKKLKTETETEAKRAMAKAEAQAADIVAKAQQQAARLVDESVITRDATKAATELARDTEAKAKAITEESKQKARDTVAQAVKQAEQVQKQAKDDALRRRAEAEQYSTQVRESAEAYAGGLLQDARKHLEDAQAQIIKAQSKLTSLTGN